MTRTRRLLAVTAASLAFGSLATPAFAETFEDMSFDGMMAMTRVDRNKDGMVTKKEFLDAMSAVWDMKMKQMNVKGDAVSEAYLRQIMMYLKAGG